MANFSADRLGEERPSGAAKSRCVLSQNIQQDRARNVLTLTQNFNIFLASIGLKVCWYTVFSVLS